MSGDLGDHSFKIHFLVHLSGKNSTENQLKKMLMVVNLCLSLFVDISFLSEKPHTNIVLSGNYIPLCLHHTLYL